MKGIMLFAALVALVFAGDTAVFAASNTGKTVAGITIPNAEVAVVRAPVRFEAQKAGFFAFGRCGGNLDCCRQYSTTLKQAKKMFNNVYKQYNEYMIQRTSSCYAAGCYAHFGGLVGPGDGSFFCSNMKDEF